KRLQEKHSKKENSTGDSREILTDFLELINKFYQKWSKSRMLEHETEPRTETRPSST
ncbi:unnamed protein product, partial [Candidula unifasciata]